MAASCKNRTLSLSDEPGFRVFTATSFVVPEMVHRALQTLPNSPDPSALTVLRNSIITANCYNVMYIHVCVFKGT